MSLLWDGGCPTGVWKRPHSGLDGATEGPGGDPEPRYIAGCSYTEEMKLDFLY